MPQDVYSEFRAQVAAALADAGVERDLITLMVPPRPEFGDLSTSAAFEMASRTGDNPRRISQELLARLDLQGADLVARATVAGAGYINFFLDYSRLVPRVLAAMSSAGASYGDLAPDVQGKAVIEHTSVNPNKPWHVGHARNAILGDTLARLFRKAGRQVEVQNYIDDTGIQVAETIYALAHYGGADPQAKFDHAVGEAYVRLHRILGGSEATTAERAEIRGGAESVLHELEEGRHRSFVERCLAAQLGTAWRLGIYYDLLVWESDIIRAHLLQEAMAKIQESERVYVAQDGPQKGCLIIEMGEALGHSGGESEEHSIDKILIRSNGLPTYTAKDIAFQMWKFGLLSGYMRYRPYTRQPGGRELQTTHPDGGQQDRPPATAVYNVIGAEQEYPQTVVRTALQVLGYECQHGNSHHISYEHVVLPEGRMSGRKGIGVSTDEVLAATIGEAERVVREKQGSALPEEDLAQIAEAVGVGAVRFAMLRNSPASRVTFKLADIVSFAGYTALYVQYAYVRAVRILAKAQEDGVPVEMAPDPSLLTASVEQALALQLALLPSTVAEAVARLDPSLVCQYAYNLAQAFGQFYESSPVLTAPSEQRGARLQLVECAATVLGITMDLLGVPVVDRL